MRRKKIQNPAANLFAIMWIFQRAARDSGAVCADFTLTNIDQGIGVCRGKFWMSLNGKYLLANGKGGIFTKI
jgi:hypothetical protein